jgi:hypothetical protein
MTSARMDDETQWTLSFAESSEKIMSYRPLDPIISGIIVTRHFQDIAFSVSRNV